MSRSLCLKAVRIIQTVHGLTLPIERTLLGSSAKRRPSTLPRLPPWPLWSLAPPWVEVVGIRRLEESIHCVMVCHAMLDCRASDHAFAQFLRDHTFAEFLIHVGLNWRVETELWNVESDSRPVPREIRSALTSMCGA
ncbi:hypothetical protein E2562_025802 [Oryza meyeriana var. granulata]|uniref:Uncharacterized protein n=1 Tax=Oryza meyeriana var. granulata TaxID=110450 RepID=A0A6G1CRK1_9ORYZ|nr:hypothetical protein E2562_025802 [Oryza meyeriana var. granulata]